MWNLRNSDQINPFFGNIGKKTLAVVIAIALWIVANLEFDIERNIKVPLNFVNLKKELVIVNKPPENIDLRIRGPRSKLSSFANSNISINYDLKDFKRGQNKINVKTEDVNFPRGVQLITISPIEFDLQVDKVISKKVNIKPQIDNPDKGYEVLNSPELEPSKLLVKGPEKELNKLDEIYTTKISLEGEQSKFSIQVPLQSPSPLIEFPEEQLVKVTVDIQEIILEKEFKDLDVDLKNFDNKSYNIRSNLKSDLIFVGPYNLINNLKSEDIKLFIDANTRGSGKLNKLQINVTYPNPEFLKLTSIFPKTIDVIFY